MRRLLLERLEAGAVLEGALVELGRYEDGLRLLAASEHDLQPEQAHLRDDLGQVGACVGDSHSLHIGLTHATRIHTSPVVISVALYNSGASESLAPRTASPP